MKKLSVGFSLFELLIVLALIVVVCSFSVPSFSTMTQRSTRFALLQQLLHQLQFCRQAAMQLGTTISLCPSDDGRHCQGQWQQGYVIFTDNLHDHIIHSPQQILRYQQILSHQTTLYYRGFPTSRYIQWQSNGLTRGQNGSFYLGERRVVISHSGRARIE